MANRPIAAAIAFGVLCRLWQYAANVSLWHDESFVALNVIHTPFAGLLGPLDWHEPSPPGFLFLEQRMVAAFGPSELALRALPLLAGVAALVLFARLASRLRLTERGALWAVLLLAASPKLIADASLVKHFTFDLLVAVALLGAAWRTLRTAAPRTRLLLGWGAVGTLCLWLSYATAFVFAGTSLALAMHGWPRWPRTARVAYVGANLCGLASAVALLGVVRLQRSDVVVGFWQRGFPDFTGVLPFAAWLGRALLALFDYFWQPLGGLLLLLAVIAARAWWQNGQRLLPPLRGKGGKGGPFDAERLATPHPDLPPQGGKEYFRTALLLLWLPVGLALLASALRWWPFGGNQHMTFAAPAVLLLAGDGIEIARDRIAVRRPALAWCAVALLFAPGIGGALYHLAAPRQRHDMRGAIAFLQAHAAPGDQVAVFDEASFAFYTGRDQRGASRAYSASEQVWVITPRSKDGTLDPGVRIVLDGLLRDRPRVLAHEPHGAAAYCFGPKENSPQMNTDEHR